MEEYEELIDPEDVKMSKCMGCVYFDGGCLLEECDYEER